MSDFVNVTSRKKSDCDHPAHKTQDKNKPEKTNEFSVSDFSCLDLQTVSQAANGGDLEGMLIFGKTFPQTTDMYIQSAVIAAKIIAPDIFDQLLA